MRMRLGSLTTQVNLAILGGHAVTESGKGTYKFRPQFLPNAYYRLCMLTNTDCVPSVFCLLLSDRVPCVFCLLLSKANTTHECEHVTTNESYTCISCPWLWHPITKIHLDFESATQQALQQVWHDHQEMPVSSFASTVAKNLIALPVKGIQGSDSAIVQWLWRALAVN